MDEILKKLGELQAKLEASAKTGESVGAIQSEILKLREEFVAQKNEIEELKKARSAKNLVGLEDEKQKFSLVKAINAIVTKDWRNAGFEREVFNNTSRSAKGTVEKTMSTEVDSTGGYIVPPQAIPDMIEILRANLITKALGATTIEGLVGSPAEMPGQSGGATVYWLGEDNPNGITASDLTLRKVEMTPHMAAALVKLSNRLLRMSNPSVEALVRQDVSFAMAQALDLAALMGTGANAEPLGLLNVLTDAANGIDCVSKTAVQLWGQMYEAENLIAEANALRGKLGWAFHPRLKKILAKARVSGSTTGGDGIFVQNPITQDHLVSYIGYPYQTTTNLPIIVADTPDSLKAIFGNWSELLIGMWQGMEIMASQEASTAFTTNQTWVRIIQECDVAVRHTESFSYLYHIDATL